MRAFMHGMARIEQGDQYVDVEQAPHVRCLPAP
jgi:hypothetical protein